MKDDEAHPLLGNDRTTTCAAVPDITTALTTTTTTKKGDRGVRLAVALGTCAFVVLGVVFCADRGGGGGGGGIPATAFEAMTGSSPPTFPPDVQCGIDICNNSGHNRAYLFTGDECQDLNPPQNDSYLTACYLEYNWDCVYIWNDLDDPYNYHIASGFASSALVQCIGGDPPNITPIGGRCTKDEQCVIPHGVNHGLCYNGVCNDYNTNPYAIPIGDKCDSHDKSPDQCQYPPGLSRGVCINKKCHDGESRSKCLKDVDCLSGDCFGTTEKTCM